jgi:hypothetical protein
VGAAAGHLLGAALKLLNSHRFIDKFSSLWHLCAAERQTEKRPLAVVSLQITAKTARLLF